MWQIIKHKSSEQQVLINNLKKGLIQILVFIYQKLDIKNSIKINS